MKVNVEEVKGILARLKQIESVPLREIEWYEDGKHLEVDDDMVEEFKFTGMPNRDFIRSEFYKKGFWE